MVDLPHKRNPVHRVLQFHQPYDTRNSDDSNQRTRDDKDKGICGTATAVPVHVLVDTSWCKVHEMYLPSVAEC